MDHQRVIVVMLLKEDTIQKRMLCDAVLMKSKRYIDTVGFETTMVAHGLLPLPLETPRVVSTAELILRPKFFVNEWADGCVRG